MNRTPIRRFFVLTCLAATAVLFPLRSAAQFSSTIEVKFLDERVAPGGSVQMNGLFTQPRPIGSGGGTLSLSGFSLAGAAVFSALGDTSGTAILQNGEVTVSILSPSSDFGTDIDYPFMMVTMDIPPTVSAGSTFPLGFSGLALFQTSTGTAAVIEPHVGTLTVAGSISVRGIYPGGGTWPAGTVINVFGLGFLPTTKISTKMKTSQAIYVSPTQLQFTLQEAATMDSQPIQVNNPDGSQVVYYSYLRGTPIQTPSRSLLQATDPMFPTQTHVAATVGPLPAFATTQFGALAIQNPGPVAVNVTLTLQRTGASTTMVLPSGARVMDELSLLLGGASLLPGDVISMSATSGVEVFGIYGDEFKGTVTPFAPTF